MPQHSATRVVQPKQSFYRIAFLLFAMNILFNRYSVSMARLYERDVVQHSIPFAGFDLWKQLDPLLWQATSSAIQYILLIVILAFPRHRAPYFILLMLMTFNQVIQYSGMGAFIQIAILALGFLLITFKSPIGERAALARMTVGLIFLFGALHKLNASFLSGCESRGSGNFSAGTVPFFKEFLASVSHSKLFTISIIAFEAVIGLLNIFPSRLGLIAAVAFGPIVALAHPPAIHVFYLMSPFIIASDFRIATHLSALFKRAAPLLILVLVALAALPHFQLSKLTKDLTLVALGAIPAALVILSIRHARLPWVPRLRFTRTWRHWWTIAVIVYALTPVLGLLPTPLGLSFFSGRGCLKSARYKIELTDSKACTFLRNRYWLYIWEAKIVSHDPSDRPFPCTVILPSEEAQKFISETLEENGFRN